MLNLLLIIGSLFAFSFSACGPTIHYLGDNFTQTESIDVYYSERDVEKEYRTIGRMTHDKFINYDADTIKKSMVENAKRRGGDGIVFTDAVVARENDLDGDRLTVSAIIIQYK